MARRLPRRRAPAASAAPREDAPTRACRASGAARRRRCTAATRTTTCSSRPTHWDEVTRRVVLERVRARVPPDPLLRRRRGRRRCGAFCDVVLAQDARAADPGARRWSTRKLYDGEARRLPLRRHARRPARPGGWWRAASTRRRASARADASPPPTQRAARRDRRRLRRRRAAAACGRRSPVAKAWEVVMRTCSRRLLLAPLGMERDRLRRPRLPARLHAPRRRQASASPTSAGGGRPRRAIRSEACGGGGCRETRRHALRGSRSPARQRLRLPARPRSPRRPRPRDDGALPTTTRRSTC